MRLFLTAILLPLIITSCQSESPGSKPAEANVATPAAVQAPSFPMTPDTIQVRGKFLPGCTMPNNIRIAIHNVDNSFWKDVPVSKTGEFSYKQFLNEPRRIALRTIYGVKFDFFATTQEKVYQIEIACNKGAETFSIIGSTENDAYQPFSAANKKLQSDLDSFAKQDISKPETFNLLKQTLTEYQKTMDDISVKYPNTFTGKVFAPAEKLPEGSLSSLEMLRKNFLQRDAYANPQIYNDFLPQRILLNYLAIRDKKGDPNEPVSTLMNIVSKNPEAAKRLQDIMSSIFYKMHQEDLFVAFINWSERNPDKMYNQSVKGRLQNMKRLVPGSPLIDFQLNDPNGKPNKLSDVVKSGKLTVLIFYSPTCGHCKEKVPQLIPLWDKYKSKGLKIYAVGNDANTDDWKKFINEHAKPEWVHALEAETGTRPSDQYFSENPTFILIDGQGKIVSRVADLEFVKEKIVELLD